MRRRSFMQLAGAVSASLLIQNSSQAIEPFDRPTPGRLRLSLAAYSMRKYLTRKANEPGAMDLFDFVDYCRKLGLSAAELTSYYFPDSPTHDYLLSLKRHCHLSGICISGGAIRNDFCQADEAKLKTDIEHTKRWVDHYALLGAPVIRIFAGQEVTDETLSKTLERCAKQCEVACAYAADKGVMLALENHGGVTATAAGLLDIVRQVDSPAFGVNLDSGNFRSTDDPYAEIKQIAPYAVNAQIKVEISRGGKTEDTDLPQVASILRNAGYSGWVALEYEAAEEPLEAIPRWLDELRPLMDG